MSTIFYKKLHLLLVWKHFFCYTYNMHNRIMWVGAGIRRVPAEGAAMGYSFEHNSLPGSLELAYLGDTIYDFYVRRALVCRGGRVQQMHREAVAMVCNQGQAEALGRIEGELSEEEAAVVRRARNAHQNPPRNANPAQYHRATGLEALIGYLYLTGRSERLNQLMKIALPEEYTEGFDEE